jgi:hypothetical protein
MVHIPILKGNNGNWEKNNGTKARQKLIKTNIKTYSSLTGIQGTWWWDVSSKSLEQPSPNTLLAIGHMAFPGLALLAF